MPQYNIENLIHKENGKWVYGDEFIQWIKDNSKKFTSVNNMAKNIGIDNRVIQKVINSNNINTEFVYGKNDLRFKAIYQDYDWCYQKYMIEGLNHKEMAKEAKCSKRVIEKWCCEIHKLTQKYRQQNVKLTKTQEDLVLGSLLGDGHIDKREGKSIFIVSHAENQKDYLFWKYELIKNLCNIPPTYIKSTIKYFNEKGYKVQPSYRICTRIYDVLDKYKNMDKISVIKNLNEFSFSIFMLDDGYRNKYYWQICVASFTEEEKNYFLDHIKQLYNVNGEIYNYDNRYINFKKEDKDIIDDIILRNIPNNLDIIKYKILDKKYIKKEVIA